MFQYALYRALKETNPSLKVKLILAIMMLHTKAKLMLVITATNWLEYSNAMLNIRLKMT